MKKKLENMQRFIEDQIPQAMREGKIPGLSMAVVMEGEVVYQGGFGLRDPARNLPATPDTLYGVGSCTKSLVAMAVMQLVEQGKLSLEDPVSQYLPLKIGMPGRSITVHHLLTHSSGIPSLATSTVALHHGLGMDTGIPLGSGNDFYRLVNGAQEELAGEPGTRFFYNNAGYRMLGHIIQELSKEAFYEYISGKIIKPLGMKRTTLIRAEYEGDPDRMIPHWKKPEGGITATPFPYPNIPDNREFSFMAAAGGLLSSVSELTRYLRVNMQGGTLGKARLLKPESLAKMLCLHIQRPPKLYGRYGYGYGWGITENFLGHKLVAHGGSILVSTAHLAFIPDLKMGVAMAANTAGPPYSLIAEGILAVLLGRDPMKAIPGLGLKERMKMLTGTYEVYKGLRQVKVLSQAGLLYLREKGPFADSLVPLIPEDPLLKSDRFYTLSEGVREPVEFVVRSPADIDLYVERYRYHKTGQP